MKTYFSIIILFLFFTINASSQGIWTVHSNPDFDADFTSLRDATISTDVQLGDLVYVHGGTYGSDTIKKQITVIGPGYFLSQNGQASSYANPLPALFDDLTIQADADNTVVSGLQIQAGLNVFPNNVVISRTYVYDLKSYNEYIYVESCFVSYRFWCIGNYNTIDLRNSFIGLLNSNVSGASISGLIRNCIINNLSENSIDIATFENNIFLYSLEGDDEESAYLNNIFVSSTTDLLIMNGSNNQVNVNASSLFVGTESGSQDGQYQLSENSPAAGAGLNGTDCGIFGGDNSYVLSGLPGIPNIYSLSTPNNATDGGGLNVEVKVKSNN